MRQPFESITWRMWQALAESDVRSPERLLAITIVGQCIDDVDAGKSADVDPFWVHAAEVPIQWVEEAGVFVGPAITLAMSRRRSA